MLDGIRQSILRARDASELKMRVNLFRVYLDGALETLARGLQFAALQMQQAEIVVRGRISRIERRRFKILLEGRAPPLRAHDFADVAAQEYEENDEQKRRSKNPPEERHQEN